jgi:predicted nicotinamide N-methyase
VVTQVNGHDVVISERAREEANFVRQPAAAAGGRRADMTGLRVWGSAYKLIDFLTANFLHQAQGLNCLELGSGTGIGGIGAAYVGMNVVLTDPGRAVNYTSEISGNTIDCLRRNVELNSSTPGVLHVRELLWGDPEHIGAIKEEFSDPFDLIIGSDLLYQHTNYQGLLDTLQDFATPTTLIVLAFKTRHGGEGRFLNQASEYFFVDEQTVGESFRLVTLTPLPPQRFALE